VALTLIDSVAPNCYHCEITVIVSRPLGHPLLSVTNLAEKETNRLVGELSLDFCVHALEVVLIG
jgi:hypothetical protein